MGPSEDPDLARCRETLEVSPNASWDEIQHAYRELVKVWHPDRFVNDRALQKRAGRKIQQINEAHRKLAKVHGAASSAPESKFTRPAADRPRQEFRFRPRPRFLPQAALLPALAAFVVIAGGLYLFHFLLTLNSPLPQLLDPHGISDQGNLQRLGNLFGAPVVTREFTVPTPDTKQPNDDHPPRSAPTGRGYPGLRKGARPENGTDLLPPNMPRGAGAIRIRNDHVDDLIAEIWNCGGSKRIARSVYVRAGEEVLLPYIGLGVYKVIFKPPSGGIYASTDLVQIYEVQNESGTQSVLYRITVPNLRGVDSNPTQPENSRPRPGR